MKPVVRLNRKGEIVEIRCGNRRAVLMPYPRAWLAWRDGTPPAKAHIWYLTHRTAGGRGWTPATRRGGRSQVAYEVRHAFWWVRDAVVPLNVFERERACP